MILDLDPLDKPCPAMSYQSCFRISNQINMSDASAQLLEIKAVFFLPELFACIYSNTPIGGCRVFFGSRVIGMIFPNNDGLESPISHPQVAKRNVAIENSELMDGFLSNARVKTVYSHEILSTFLPA